MQNNDIIQSVMFFNLTPDQLEAIEQVLKQDTILKTGECPVLDVEGNPLVKDKIYQCRKRRYKIRGWEFGTGNMLDRYYRLYYTNDKLEDSFMVIGATYKEFVFGGAIYQSDLSIVEKPEN